MSADPVNSVPLWLLYDDEMEAWRATQTPFVGAWLSEQGFKGERHRVLLVPDAKAPWHSRRAVSANVREGCLCGMPPVSSSACRRAAFASYNAGAMRRRPS